MASKLMAVTTDKAPAAAGPYSAGIISADFVFCAGQIGVDPTTNALVAEDTLSQARQALENLQAVVEAAGSSFAQVVRTDLFLTDINDFAAVNQLYAEYFTTDPKPARQTVQVAALPKAAKFEISCIARLG